MFWIGLIYDSRANSSPQQAYRPSIPIPVYQYETAKDQAWSGQEYDQPQNPDVAKVQALTL